MRAIAIGELAISEVELVLEDALERLSPEADQDGVVGAGATDQPFADLELPARDAINDQVRPRTAVQFEGHLVRTVEDEAAVEQHVRRHRRQYQAP